MAVGEQRNGEGKQRGILCSLSVTLEQHRQQEVALAVRFVFGSHPAAVDRKCRMRMSCVCLPKDRARHFPVLLQSRVNTQVFSHTLLLSICLSFSLSLSVLLVHQDH